MAGQASILCWTWLKGRKFRTKGEAQKKLLVWKRWYERQGWTVRGSAATGYIATAPDYDPTEDAWLPPSRGRGPNPKVHSAAVQPDNGSYLTTAEASSRLTMTTTKEEK